MTLLELRKYLRKDIKRWGGKSGLYLYLMKKEFRLVFRYRILKYFESHVLTRPLYFIERFLYHQSCNHCGCDIPSHVSIGAGFKILHSWGIVINSHSIIGENCTIVSGALIGATRTGVPIIGSNVSIGAHAIILGGIKVENDAEIGAGAIVTHDVPTNGVVYSDASELRRIKNTNI